MVTKISLAEKFSRFSDQWSPKIVADLNDSHVKLAKVQGEGPGELVVIPKGVEHRPVARDEVHLMLIEPRGIRHTGDTITERTVLECARI